MLHCRETYLEIGAAMSATKILLGSVGVAGLLFATPAMATCGGKDKNGCSVSKTTYKKCSADLAGDLKELQCDVKDLLHDIARGKSQKTIARDLADIQADLKELKFDYKILASLQKPKGKGKDDDDDDDDRGRGRGRR